MYEALLVALFENGRQVVELLLDIAYHASCTQCKLVLFLTDHSDDTSSDTFDLC